MNDYDWRGALLGIAVFFTALGICDPAPAADLEGLLVYRERTMDRALTGEEQARLLGTQKEAACRDVLSRRDAAAINALLHSGLRIGEFLQITVGQALAAIKDGYLFVPKEHRKGFSKGVAKDHMVFMTHALRRDIEDLLKVRVELAQMDCHTQDPLVVGRSGRRMTVRNFELRYKLHARDAGLAKSSPHWLRHTRGQNIMLRSSARDPRGVVQRALGHADIRSSGVYTQTPREDVEAALAEIDAPAAGRVTKAQLRKVYDRGARA